MKKIFIALLISAITFSMVACSENVSDNISRSDSKATAIASSRIENTKLTLTFSFGTRTGTYSGDINSQGTPDGTGTFISKSDDGTSWTYNGDWDNGHWNGQGTTQWDTGQSYSGEYKDDYMTGQGTYTSENGKKYEDTTFYKGEPCGDGTLYYTDGSYFKGEFSSFTSAKGTYCDKDGYEYNAEISNDELTKKWPLHDFFDDKKNQDEYIKLYESYKYTELSEYLNKYIKDKSPSPMDSAYTILDMIKPLIKYEGTWSLTHDDFDDTYTLNYKNTTKIDENNCVETSVCGTTQNTTFGFVKNDWLFFDNIRISVDGKVVVNSHFRSSNIQRDTLGGSLIKESVNCSLNEDEVNSMIKGKKVKIRFENEDKNEYYEKELSKSQVEALYCTVYLGKNNRDLSNLLFDYNRRE